MAALDQLERAWKKWLAVAGLTMRGKNNPTTAGDYEQMRIPDNLRKTAGDGAKATVTENERENQP